MQLLGRIEDVAENRRIELRRIADFLMHGDQFQGHVGPRCIIRMLWLKLDLSVTSLY